MESIFKTKALNDDVHIWLAEHSKWARPEMVTYLDASESKKLQELRHPRRYSEYLAGRYLLKNFLAAYTGIGAQEVNIKLSERGKPRFVLPSGIEPVYFNLSHSGPYLAFVFDARDDVGIDIEYRKKYTSDQRSDDLCLKDLEKLKVWTRKEAALKLSGDGLQESTPSKESQLMSIDQETFVLSVATRKSARAVHFMGFIDGQ
ncbi:MAG: hypothetical protein KDD61_13115 [Bdellovibrionales bacterium]|nr:hypothetical protein [Bdellovibrionales bacterium]